jgi:hypothetical protein
VKVKFRMPEGLEADIAKVETEIAELTKSAEEARCT